MSSSNTSDEDRKRAQEYCKYRPTYASFVPEEIMHYVRRQNRTRAKDDKLGFMIDVGCGNGQSTHMFAPYFDSILGIDISPGQLEVAVEKNISANVSFKLVHDNVFPATDVSVDLVGCGTALHAMDAKVFVSECERVLRPGGCVAIYTQLPVAIKSTKGGEFDPTFVDLQMALIKNCKAHQRTFLWRDGYKTIFNRISNSTKTWLPCQSSEKEYCLKEYIKTSSTLGEYRDLMKSQSKYDPMEEFVAGIKTLLKEENTDDEDVKFILKIDHPLIVFTKQ